MYSYSEIVRLLQVPHPANEEPPTALINHDVKPIEKERRTWGWPAFLGFWTVIAFNTSGFNLGSALLAVGLNWWQTLIGTLVGHIFGAGYVVAMSMPGLHYHISFPVTTRVAWGFYGTIFVILNRILLSAISTGIQIWLGGLLTYGLLRSLWPSIDNVHNSIPASTGLTTPTFIGVIVFFIIQAPLLVLNPKRLRLLLYIGGISGFITQTCLVIWACATMGPEGFGTTLSSQSVLSGPQLGWVMMYSMSFTISSITAGSVAICDYTRFGKSISSGVWPQLFGWLPTWISSTFGILTVAATQNRYGETLWNVPTLLVQIQTANPDSATRAAVFFCCVGFLLPQLALNVSGNTFGGATDLSALFPKFINIRRGQIVTACIGLIINPWYLMSSAIVFVTVFSSYTVFIQPFMGIMIAQYFIVQKYRLKVTDLYIAGPESIYWYNYGVNWRAALAWCSGVSISLPGFLVAVGSPLKVSSAALDIYYLCGFTGAIISFSLTIGLDYLFPVQKQRDWVASVTIQEAYDLTEDYIFRLGTANVISQDLSREDTMEAETVEVSFLEK